MIQNQLQKSIETIAAFIFLNLLWFIFCLPIITIYPSTAAMFRVVRDWKNNEIDYAVGKQFVARFRENFSKSFQLGILWSLLGILIMIDFYFLWNFSFPRKSAIAGLLVFFTFIYMGMSIFLLFVTVSFDLTVKAIIKNAFLLTISRIGTTFVCLVTVASIGIICYFIPFLLWIVGSITAYTVYSIICRVNQGMSVKRKQHHYETR